MKSLTAPSGWRAGLLCLALAPLPAVAEGGPPLLTDDPGTPGNAKWEINVAATAERGRAGWSLGLPLVDVNYGLGERVQFKAELPWMVRSAAGRPTATGLGNGLLGAKLRFLDESRKWPAVSVYPQLGLNTFAAGIHRGLAEPGPELLLPLQVQKSLGPVSVNLELGRFFARGTSGGWIYGLALGHEIQRLEVMAEVHGEADSGFRNHEVVLNAGCRWRLDRERTLLFSLGRGVAGRAGERPDVTAYLGLRIEP
ncbi:MAG: hypothetical protein HYU66_06595 [Armatimonadetes bacterium]|nr:hypothetical protein [Armatimonadota bacterium]